MTKLVTIFIEEIEVLTNGDSWVRDGWTFPQDKPKKKDNAIVGTLLYPRSGAQKVVSAKVLHLDSGRPRTLENDYWKQLLFKEEVQGETKLQIEVTDKDAGKSLRGLLATVLGAGLGVLTGGISNVALGAIAGYGKDSLLGSIKTAKGFPVAASKPLGLRIDSSGDLLVDDTKVTLLDVPLTVPKSFPVNAKVRKGGPSSPLKTASKKFKKGDPNGTVRLRFEVSNP